MENSLTMAAQEERDLEGHDMCEEEGRLHTCKHPLTAGWRSLATAPSAPGLYALGATFLLSSVAHGLFLDPLLVWVPGARKNTVDVVTLHLGTCNIVAIAIYFVHHSTSCTRYTRAGYYSPGKTSILHLGFTGFAGTSASYYTMSACLLCLHDKDRGADGHDDE